MIELLKDVAVCLASATVVAVALVMLAAFIQVVLFELRGDDDFYH